MSASLKNQSRSRKQSGKQPSNPVSSPLAQESDFDDWDFNYKLQGGRLISKSVYSGGPTNVQSFPPKSSRVGSLITHSPNLSRPSQFPPSHDSGNRKISLHYDPEPIFETVDVKSDNEFLTGLRRETISTFNEERPLYEPCHNDLHLKIWREHAAQVPLGLATSNPQNKKKNTILTTTEKISQEFCAPITDDSSSAASATQGTEIKKEMSIDSRTGLDSIRICSRDGGSSCVLSRQIVELSKVFAEMTKNDTFDGEIILDEDKEALELLTLWMSRDLEFEITIGTLPI
jgi:hypothetical protein